MNMLKREHDYRYTVPKQLRKKYRNESKRFLNYIGFLVRAWKFYGSNESFFLSNSEILEELGGSKTTIKKYDDRLVADGVIEKRQGDWKTKKVNEYRLLGTDFTPKCTERIDEGSEEKSVPRKEEKKCTESTANNSTETERVMKEIEEEKIEKSVPRKEEKKCTESTANNSTETERVMKEIEEEKIEKSVPRDNNESVPRESVPRNEVKKCTESIDINSSIDEGVTEENEVSKTEKSVPRNEEKKCTTVYRVKDSNMNSLKDHVSGINLGNSLQESNITESCMKESEEASHAKVEVTGEVENQNPLPKARLFFKFRGLGGFNEKLLSLAPYKGDNLTFQQMKEGSAWLWKSWRHYKETVPTLQQSYEEVEQATKTYYHLITVYYSNRGKRDEFLTSMKKEETVFMRSYLLNRWAEFLQQVRAGEYSRSELNKTKEEFYKRVQEWFSFKEGVDKEDNSESVLYRLCNDYTESVIYRNNSNKVFDISTVDDMIAAEEPLENILHALQGSNLSKEQIMKRWKSFHSTTTEKTEVPSKSCKGGIPNGLKEWVEEMAKKYNPSQVRNAILNTPWSDYRDDVEHLMVKAGYTYTAYTDLPF